MLNSTLSRISDTGYNDLDKRLLETKKRFFDQKGYYLTYERRFFKDHAYPILLRRAQGTTIAKSDEVWESFSNKIADILLESPEHFVKRCKFPYLKTLLSIKAIELRLLDTDQLYNLHWVGIGLFIDVGDSDEAKLGVDKPLSVISNLSSITAHLVDEAPQYALREVILALVDSYDVKLAMFTGNWRKRIEHRASRKVEQKQAYLGVLSNIWSARNIAEGVKVASTYGVNANELLGKRLSLTKWKRYIQFEIASHFYSKGYKTSAEVQGQFFQFELQLRASTLDHPQLFKTLAEKIYESIENIKRSFPVVESEIEKALIAGFRSRMATFDIKDAAFQKPYIAAVNERRSISRMKLAKATKTAYLDAINYYSVVKLLNSECYSVWSFHKTLAKLGVSESASRNFIKTIYNSKLWSDEKYLHDMSTEMVPELTSFVKSLKAKPKYKQVYNTIIKLITSQIAGGSFNANILSDLLTLNYCQESFENTKINSLNQLVSLLFKSDSRMATAIELSQQLNIKTVEERDIGIIAGMRLTTQLNSYLNQLKPIASSDQAPIATTLGRLNIAIQPHDQLLGILGAGVPGVCIRFGSRHHYEHLNPRCRNLIVYDDSRILLWGLLVEADCGQWYLNNFQGSLPSSHRKHSSTLIQTVHNLLGQLGNVYLLDFSFNAMSLCEGLEEVEEVSLCLPKMRLDISQDNEGNLIYHEFYKIKKLTPTDHPAQKYQ